MRSPEPALIWYSRLKSFPGVSWEDWLGMPAQLVDELDYIAAQDAKKANEEARRLRSGP